MSTFITIPDDTKKEVQDQNIMMSESIINYSTVSSLCNEDQMLKGCQKSLESNTMINGLSYAVSWFLCNFYFFVTFYAASEIILDGHSFTNIFMGISAGILGSTQLGVALQNAPDWSRGKAAAKKVIRILNTPPEGTLESNIVDGDITMNDEYINGDIEFKNVWFRYPAAPDQWVLQNFNLTIRKGESIGLAGESGCGKSTIINLLLRFYDPDHGDILINRVSIQSFTLKSLRERFGLVQQEPIIFSNTILENI